METSKDTTIRYAIVAVVRMPVTTGIYSERPIAIHGNSDDSVLDSEVGDLRRRSFANDPVLDMTFSLFPPLSEQSDSPNPLIGCDLA